MNYTEIVSLVIHNYFDASAIDANLNVQVFTLFSMTALDDEEVMREMEDVFGTELRAALPRGLGNYTLRELGSIVLWEVT